MPSICIFPKASVNSCSAVSRLPLPASYSLRDYRLTLPSLRYRPILFSMPKIVGKFAQLHPNAVISLDISQHSPRSCHPFAPSPILFSMPSIAGKLAQLHPNCRDFALISPNITTAAFICNSVSIAQTLPVKCCSSSQLPRFCSIYPNNPQEHAHAHFINSADNAKICRTSWH